MNTPEHDDWERLFRQRLANLEAQPPADALTRILAVANPLSTPVAPRPGSASKTFGVGGMVAVLLGIWLMQATQCPYHALTESAQISRETMLSTGHRPSDSTSLAKGKREPEPLTFGSAESRISGGPLARIQPRTKASREDVLPTGHKSPEYTALAEGKRKRHGPPAAPLTLGSAEDQISRGPVARTQPRTKASEEDVPSTGHRPSEYTALAEGKRELPAPAPKYTTPDFNRRLTFAGLETQRTVQPYHKQILMAETTPEAAPTAPAMVRQRPARAWFVAVTPGYTYQQITPVHTDERYVEQVQTPGSFSGGRAGWRAQIGMEQAINKRFAVRAGLTVSQLRQSVQYSSRGASFDSARVEVLDNQSIRLTPLYRRQTDQLATVRQFVGISGDVIWRPLTQSAPLNQAWQPYLTAGLSAGKYTGSGSVVSGFWQASAGVERAVWPGWWLRVEPSVQYGWRALTDSPVLTTRPYTYGLTIGLRH